MRKSAEAFRTISEVSELLETPAHVLRFWESKFPQVKPVKRAGGRRYYRPADIALLGGIKKLLHGDGMTIRGVQKLLGKHGARHVAEMSPYPLPAETAPPPSARRTASRGGGKTAGQGGAGHRVPAPEGRADPGRLIETAVDGIRNRRPKATGDAAGDAGAGAAAEAARAAAPPDGAEGARPAPRGAAPPRSGQDSGVLPLWPDSPAPEPAAAGDAPIADPDLAAPIAGEAAAGTDAAGRAGAAGRADAAAAGHATGAEAEEAPIDLDVPTLPPRDEGKVLQLTGARKAGEDATEAAPPAPPPMPGLPDIQPAARMLRAMDALHAGPNRDRLQQVYRRLADLKERMARSQQGGDG